MSFFIKGPKAQFFDSNGDPLASGKLYTYDPGTTDNKATYPTLADADAATNANTNPVILDSRGEGNICSVDNIKLVLKDSNDVTIWTVDNYDADAAKAPIKDSNGNELIKGVATTSAVNEFTVTNAATGGAPELSVTGSDASVSMDFAVKGSSGIYNFKDHNDNELFQTVAGVVSATNFLTITNAATGNQPIITGAGSDANVGLKLAAKADGNIDITTAGGDITLTSTSGDVEMNGSTVTLTCTAGVTIASAIATISGSASSAGEIRLSEDTDNGTNYASIKAPASIAANYTLTLPADDGTNTELLMTDGSGTLTWNLIDDLTADASPDGAADYLISYDATAGTHKKVLMNDVPFTGLSAATQAEMETGTATDKVVTPGRQHFHAGHCKAWCHLDGTGTPAADASYNVASIDDDGAGLYGVNFTTALSSAEYATVCGGWADGAVDGTWVCSARTQLAGSVDVQVEFSGDNSTANILGDIDSVAIAVFGDI